jgi:hypothetical protein
MIATAATANNTNAATTATTASTPTTPTARATTTQPQSTFGWFLNRDAQTAFSEEIARSTGLDITAVRTARCNMWLIMHQLPRWGPTFLAAARAAVIREVRNDMASRAAAIKAAHADMVAEEYAVHEKAYQKGHRAELKEARRNGAVRTPPTRIQPARRCAAAAVVVGRGCPHHRSSSSSSSNHYY